MAPSNKKYNFNFIYYCSSQPYLLNMQSIDLLELIHHNRDSLYFVCLIDMLVVNKYYVKDY